MNWTAETTWPVKKGVDVFSLNSGTIICNFLYWQAESYVSFRFRFWIDGNRNCPLAKGQRPQEAQTRQQTLGPHKFFKLNLR